MQLKRGPPRQAEGGPKSPASICRVVAMGRRPRRYAWRSHMTLHSRPILLIAALAVGLVASSSLNAAENPKEIRVDWATYNAGSIDFGSSAGSAALVARINGNPIKSIYVYSKPEWTALVTTKDSKINKVEDLKGKKVAMVRGTDPHIFAVRALLAAGLTDRDITPVLVQQHADGGTALIRGDVDAWAGLDPMMAQHELIDGARLFYRNPDANTWGILNAREEFLKDHPDLAKRVTAAYEEARKYSLANYDELKKIFIAVTKLREDVVDKQLKERTGLTYNKVGPAQRESILEAGVALQKAGVIGPRVDVQKAVDDLIDDRFVVTN